MFIIITLFFIPVYGWYGSNEFLHSNAANPLMKFPLMTLGNVGGAHVHCSNKKIESQSLSFECPTGTDIDYDNIIYGVMSPKLELNYYCSEAAIDASDANDGIVRCSDFVNKAMIESQIA
jgi:hypothetical protein